MENNIRYLFREVYHITQATLAEDVTRRCKADGTGYSCTTSFISALLDKAVRGTPLNAGKETVVYNHLLDKLEELKHGKAGA